MWIKHPRSGKPDTMLTIAIASTAITLGKFLLHGVSFSLGDFSLAFGSLEATLVGAILTPTLGAYCFRKYSDSPDKKAKSAPRRRS